MLKVFYRLIGEPTPKQIPKFTGDVLLTGVVNQKALSQNKQQALAIISAQIETLTEAQFGFATNDNSDCIQT